MKKSVSSRKAANVPDSLRQRLHTYGLAATTAGVTMLALAPPGEAEIIYKPADLSTDSGTIYLDINGDGTTDFTISAIFFWPSASWAVGKILAYAAQTGNGFVAAPLPLGASIGPAANFVSRSSYMAWGFWSDRNGSRHPRWKCYGSWSKVHKGYLALRFMISGEVHYGWARMNEGCYRGAQTAKVTGYAYETIPNQGLKAGQKKGELEDESATGPGEPTPRSAPVRTPATLGMLAKGAPTVSIWRREQDLEREFS